MYNVEDLEDQWRVYRSKKRIPWYLFIVAELVVAIYIANSTAVNRSVKQFIKDSNITIAFREHSPSTENVTNSVVDINVSPKIVVDDPELLESVEKEHKRKYLKIEVTDKYPKNKSESKKDVANEIRRSNSPESNIEHEISEAKKNFLKTKSYDDALIVAKTYYEDGQYLESEKWALVTNNINNSAEEGWFVFVKSKVKMGNREEALEVLEVYIEKTGSEAAKKLLIDIEKGKI